MKARLFVFGINHRTCPLDIREKYAVSGEDLLAVLTQARNLSGVEGAVVLSTCNRTEFYCLSDNNTDVDFRSLFGLIEKIRGNRPVQPEMVYTLADEAAVRHLFRVTSGLDSMVLGEPQITGQVKQSLAEARRVGTVGPALGRLFEYAFKTAKEVRTQTGIGKGAVSVGYVALELARKIFGKLSDTSLLLIGAGEIAEAAAKNLAGAGVRDCVVTNRTFSRAVEVAEKFNWRAEPFEKLDDLLVDADIAVIAVGAGNYILDHNRVRNAVKQRRYRYLFLVDMGVPRAVEPTVRDEENVFLYDIDDVEEIIHEHIEERREYARQAESMVEQRIAAGMAIIRETDTRRVLGDLARHLDDVRQAELEKAMVTLKNQPADRVMAALTKALVNKLFHPVFTALKSGTDRETAKVIADLFLDGAKPKIEEKHENKDRNQDQ